VIGIVITSIIQSSSTTTSIVVAMVAGGTLLLQNAIPIVMGANIGTTVTNTIVSFCYVNRKTEFERAFGGAIIHDIFNISATLFLFPIELYTGILFRSSQLLTKVFEGAGGFKFVSPLKIILEPVALPIAGFIGNHYVLLIIALILLFFSMKKIVENMRGIVMEKIEVFLNRYFFRNAFISLCLGMIFTALVQSSSITTSIIVPLVGAGMLSIEQVFPYTLGANIGTTITAILAALTFGIEASMAVAFSHLLFNVFGIIIIYPIRVIPISIAKIIARFVSKSKKHFLIFLVIYILLHILPIVFALFE
jgi:sodium-dependent phosphate cotransporter